MNITDIDKQIALEITKAIIQSRNENTSENLGYRGKSNDVSYWTDLYKECLIELNKKKGLNINPDVLNDI